MKKRLYVSLFLVAVFAGLAGCGSGTSTGIALENTTGHTLGWVNIVSEGSGWDGAEDLLDGELANGDTEFFGVVAGTYDIRWGPTGSSIPDGSRSGLVVIQDQVTYTAAVNN